MDDKRTLIICALIIAGGIAIGLAPRTNRAGSIFSPAKAETKKQKLELATHKNTNIGFNIQYPKGWRLDRITNRLREGGVEENGVRISYGEGTEWQQITVLARRFAEFPDSLKQKISDFSFDELARVGSEFSSEVTLKRSEDISIEDLSSNRMRKARVLFLKDNNPLVHRRFPEPWIVLIAVDEDVLYIAQSMGGSEEKALQVLKSFKITKGKRKQ